MLDVTFLGIHGSIQEMDSGNTSLLIKTAESCLLVDVSTNIQEAVTNALDAVVITHDHIDHLYGIPSLLHQLWLKGRTQELTIYAPNAVCPLVENLIQLFHLKEKKNFFPLHVKTMETFTLKDLTVSSFKTDHTNDSIGLLMESGGKRLLYTADTRPILHGEEAWKSVDLLIHEASGTQDAEETLIKKGHSSGKDAALLAKDIQAGKLIVCHLPAKEKSQEIWQEAYAIYPKAELPEALHTYSL